MNFFAKNEDFSKIFEILLHRSPQKSLFIAFLLTNFPKISKISAQKFFAAPSAPKMWRNTPIFSAQVWKIPPPPLRGHPPPKISLVYTSYHEWERISQINHREPSEFCMTYIYVLPRMGAAF